MEEQPQTPASTPAPARVPAPPPIKTAAAPPDPPIVQPEGFSSQCPACGYDLSASPDGPCPECGVPFTHEALITTEWQRRIIRPPSQTDLVLALLVTVASFIAVGAELGQQLMVFAIIWGLITSWLLRHGHRLFYGREVLLLWLIVPLARTGAGFILTPYAIPAAAAAMACILAIVAFAYLRSPVETLAALGLGIGLPLLCIGLWFSGEGLSGVLAGKYWSDWDYPFWDHLTWPYADRNHRAVQFSYLLWFGLIVLGLSILPLVIGLAAFKRLVRKAGEITILSAGRE